MHYTDFLHHCCFVFKVRKFVVLSLMSLLFWERMMTCRRRQLLSWGCLFKNRGLRKLKPQNTESLNDEVKYVIKILKLANLALLRFPKTSNFILAVWWHCTNKSKIEKIVFFSYQTYSRLKIECCTKGTVIKKYEVWCLLSIENWNPAITLDWEIDATINQYPSPLLLSTSNIQSESLFAYLTIEVQQFKQSNNHR